MLPITTGVPQGSILGLLLLIIYMNDIHRACKHFHPILFADDTNLTSSLCSFNEEQNTPDRMISLSQVINNELKEIQKWLELNKLSLNVKKTKYMIFHNHQRDIINHTPKLELNGEPLVRVEDFNFLGLTIDQHMTWNAHIQKISNKISRSLGVMNRLKRYLPQNILRTIYNSLILPHINYSILVWGFKSSRISKLQKGLYVWYLVVNIMHILSRYLNLWTFWKLKIFSKLKFSNSITNIHKKHHALFQWNVHQNFWSTQSWN